mmetsp:Transcript_10183/g.29917  ORF Transcript_10183/g.29917 Transcript_10183/m.29917 type:complete len:239 (+) Transcript_10183:208-924(+)
MWMWMWIRMWTTTSGSPSTPPRRSVPWRTRPGPVGARGCSGRDRPVVVVVVLALVPAILAKVIAPLSFFWTGRTRPSPSRRRSSGSGPRPAPAPARTQAPARAPAPPAAMPIAAPSRSWSSTAATSAIRWNSWSCCCCFAPGTTAMPWDNERRQRRRRHQRRHQRQRGAAATRGCTLPEPIRRGPRLWPRPPRRNSWRRGGSVSVPSCCCCSGMPMGMPMRRRPSERGRKPSPVCGGT